MTTTTYAGRFDFEDGGTYCGGWEDGKAHGHGVCTGPKGMGEFSGLWQFGYEVSGVYIWPSGNCFLGQWMSGKRHGLGVEKKQRWIYKGEWSQGFKGRYGVRVSESSGAKYEGTWANGLQDGYGSETYADGGTYFGQMMQGMRNGYGIRKSVAYGVASRYRSKDVKDSMTSLRSEDGDEKVQRERDRRFDENRGGFVLRAKSDLTEEVAVGGGVTSLIISTNQAVGGGNIMSNAINSLIRRRRNSLTQQQHQHSHLGNSAERKPSLRKTLMSKLKKQKSVGDIDEVNAVGGAAGSSSHLNKLGLGGGSSSRGHSHHHHQGNNKKSSFRSTSSNNSVDSRASNRTAPAGLSAVNTLLLNGGHVGNTLHHHHQNNQAMMDDGEHSFISQDEITDINCIEVYMGEWKQDKRTGYGIAERSDGLKYEGEWFNNKKNGYGVTTFKDGTKEEGKYKNNVLTTDKKKSGKMMLLRPNKLRQKIDAAVNAALKAGQIAQQRADIALARAVNARTKAHAAELSAKQAQADSDFARVKAAEVAPDFVQPGELKKHPGIAFDIDRMPMNHPYSFQPQIMPHLHQQPGGGALNISDHSSAAAVAAAMSQMSPPNQFRKLPLNMQTNRPPDGLMSDQAAAAAYMSWHNQQSQQHSSYTPHSSTPPPTSSPMTRQLTPGGAMQYQYESGGGLIIPASQLQHQSQQMLDNTSQKLSNEMIGLDAQTLAHIQQLHQTQSSLHPKHHHMFQHNYSFDEQQLQSPNSLHTPGGGGAPGQSLLQQAQSHSFNMDMMLNTATPGGGVSTSSANALGVGNQMDSYLQHQMFQHALPKRSTLKRSQRLTDTSLEEEAAAAAAAAAAGYMMMPQLSPEQIMSLTPPQQQQYLLMRAQQQHYSQNASNSTGAGGPESGIGSSVYTNSGANNNDLLQNNLPAHLQHLNRQHLQQQSSYINNISPHSIISSQGSTGAGSHGDTGLDPSKMTSGSSQQQSHQQELPQPVQLPRRKSLPSMVKSKSFKEDETAHSSSELNKRNAELYIIENGIRKRVTERTNSALNNMQNRETGGDATTSGGGGGIDADGNERVLPRIYHYEDDDTTMELPRKIVLESITSLNNNGASNYTSVSKRVSMPSIPAYLNPKFANKVMSREEANRLSSLRRDELRKNEELERNKLLKIRNMLRNDSISMFFKNTVDCSIQTDDEDYLNWIKDGILRNRIFLLIILFNISLAIWFLQMLK